MNSGIWIASHHPKCLRISLLAARLILTTTIPTGVRAGSEILRAAAPRQSMNRVSPESDLDQRLFWFGRGQDEKSTAITYRMSGPRGRDLGLSILAREAAFCMFCMFRCASKCETFTRPPWTGRSQAWTFVRTLDGHILRDHVDQ